MPAIYCEICKKRMVTPKILEAHMAKSHSEQPKEAEKVAVEPVDLPAVSEDVDTTSAETLDKEIEPLKVEPVTPEVKAPENQPVQVEGDGEMVVLRSADNRALEVSIGAEIWKGKEISVPKEQAISVRRLLVEGGFFLKD